MSSSSPRPSCLRRAVGIVVLAAAAVALPGRAFAQDTAQMGISALQEQAQTYVAAGDLVGAIPFLEELERRLKDSTGETRKGLELVYFSLGLGYMQSYGTAGDDALPKAVGAFTNYLTAFPEGDRVRFALANRADVFRVQGKFREAADDLIKVLSPPLLQRSDESFRRRSLEALSLSLVALQAWQEALPWLRQFLNDAVESERKALAASLLLQACIELQRFDEALTLLPFLVGDTPARYDIGLNLALIKGGDRLQGLDRVPQAALLYYLALTTEEIRDFLDRSRTAKERQVAQLKSLQRGGDRVAQLEGELAQVAAQRQALDGLPNFTADLEWRRARIYSLMDRALEAFWAYRRLVERFPDAPLVEDYVFAMVTEARRAGRPDDALEAGLGYLRRDEWIKYRREITLSVVETYGERGEIEPLLALAGAFVDQFPEDPFSGQMLYQMGRAWLGTQRFEDLLARCDPWWTLHQDKPMADGLAYWTGMGRLFQGDFAAARTRFDELTKRFPESPYFEDGTFRGGVCAFGLEAFDEADRIFEAFVAKWPDSVLRGEAEVFLGDIAAQAARVDEALAHYARVEMYTDTMRFIDHAYFQGGKLLEANKRYPEMAANFEQYLNRFRERADVAGAVFELGRAKELMGRPEEMLEDYLGAVRRFGNDPVAEGVDRILEAYPGKDAEHRSILEANLDLRKRLRSDPGFVTQLTSDRRFRTEFFRANPLVDVDFRNAVNRDPEFARRLAADAAFREEQLAVHEARAARFPSAKPVPVLRELYLGAVADGSRTLALRLLKALDALGEAPAEDLVFTADDLAPASGATLTWIGDRLRAVDLDLASAAYDRVIATYPSSEAMLGALLGRGEVLAARGDIEGALVSFSQVDARFPTAPQAPFARIRQGDMLVQLGRFAEAIERYQDVVRTREWRGPATVEAQFKIGAAHQASGDFLQAHGFFQRVYVAYPQVAPWAARAYLASAECLTRLDRRAEARATIEEMLANPAHAASPEAAEARRMIGTSP